MTGAYSMCLRKLWDCVHTHGGHGDRDRFALEACA